MRIPICTEASDLVETFEAFGYQRFVNRMIWEWTGDKWRMEMSGARDERGYLSVSVDRLAAEYLDRNPGPMTVPKAKFHRLLYALEVGELPQGGPGSPLTVDHVDGDKTNDNPRNLQIMTRTGNRQKARPYGTGYCDKGGHPILGKNAKNKGGKRQTISCRYCDIEKQRVLGHRAGRIKTLKPMPNFWLWMLQQYGDAPDPELAMLHDTGMLVPVVV